MLNSITVILSIIGALCAIISAIAAIKALLMTPAKKIQIIKREIKSLLTNEIAIALWLIMEIDGFTPQNIGDILSVYSKSNRFKRKSWIKHIPVAVQELRKEGYDLFIGTGNPPQGAIQIYHNAVIRAAYEIDPDKAERLKRIIASR